MIEIIPTNTCPPDIAELARRSEAFAAFALQVHLDVGDGAFVTTLSWPYGKGQWVELEHMLPYAAALRYEAHLMVQDPLRIGELLARAGCARILAHLEVFADARAAREAFAVWKAAGAREIGLVLLIDTSLSALDPLASDLDAVLLMSIATLGQQGAPFDDRIFARVTELHTLYPDLVIAVDGGVSDANIGRLAAAGATRFAAGSAISKALDPAAAYERLLDLARMGITAVDTATRAPIISA